MLYIFIICYVFAYKIDRQNGLDIFYDEESGFARNGLFYTQEKKESSEFSSLVSSFYDGNSHLGCRKICTWRTCDFLRYKKILL